MKTLLLIRHAEAGWGNLKVADIDRTLTQQGILDAIHTGAKLKEKKIMLDKIYTSISRRTIQTSTYIAHTLQLHNTQIIPNDILYNATENTIQQFITSLENPTSTIAIVCHNPGIHLFVNSLTPTNIPEMTPCSVACFSVACEDWSSFAIAQKELLFFETPNAPLV